MSGEHTDAGDTDGRATPSDRAVRMPGDDAEPADAVARLRAATARLEDLQAADGEFRVVCGETGIAPDPVTGMHFASYEDAEAACEAARSYRDALRTLDPTLAEYDLLACPEGADAVQAATVREVVDHQRAHGLPRAESRVTLAGDGYDEWLCVENAPVVHLTGPDSLLDDELVTRQLDSKL